MNQFDGIREQCAWTNAVLHKYLFQSYYHIIIDSHREFERRSPEFYHGGLIRVQLGSFYDYD